jgi:hypothetical protein
MESLRRADSRRGWFTDAVRLHQRRMAALREYPAEWVIGSAQLRKPRLCRRRSSNSHQPADRPTAEQLAELSGAARFYERRQQSPIQLGPTHQQRRRRNSPYQWRRRRWSFKRRRWTRRRWPSLRTRSSKTTIFFPRARKAPPSDSSPSFLLWQKVYIIHVIGSYGVCRPTLE